MTGPRSAEWLLEKIYKALTGHAGAGGAAGALEVVGTGTTGQDDRLDVGLMFNRVGAHVNVALAGVITLLAPAGARRLMIQATTQNIRMTLDGTTPTATVGFQLSTSAAPIVIPLGVDVSIKLIQETAGAVANYQWLD